MSLSNINQLLLRNVNLLAAQAPLFVNLPVDNFLGEYQEIYPKAQLSCYHSNFEHHQQTNALKSARVSSVFSAHYQSDIQHDLVIIHFPKSKAEFCFTLAMLAEVVNEETTLLIVGENKSGIKSLAKPNSNIEIQCQKLDAARHCLLFIGNFNKSQSKFRLDDWLKPYAFSINNIDINVVALPGVFSQNDLDIGTRVLLENLTDKITGRVLDFGCGAGVIASYLGKKYKDVQLELLDVNALALYSAKKTIELNGLTGQTFASNSLSNVEGKYDYVISNPPFHQGIKTNYLATESFLKKIKVHMAPRSKIIIVANSFLRYQPIMESSIGRTTKLCSKKGFSLYHCSL